MISETAQQAIKAAKRDPEARKIAEQLTPKELSEFGWWANPEKVAKAMVFTPTPEMESLHQKGLIWSPMWLPATVPPWARNSPRLTAIWRYFDRRRPFWRITAMIYPLPKIGITKLGKRVAKMMTRPPKPDTLPPAIAQHSPSQTA
jgi:hypothetical protein